MRLGRSACAPDLSSPRRKSGRIRRQARLSPTGCSCRGREVRWPVSKRRVPIAAATANRCDCFERCATLSRPQVGARPCSVVVARPPACVAPGARRTRLGPDV